MSCFFRDCRVKSRNKSHTTLFSVPKDRGLFEKWRQVIPQTERRLTISDKLCEVHFERHCISFFYETKLGDGSLHRIVRGNPLLKQGSIPSIFPDEPDVSLEEKKNKDTANNKSTVDGIEKKILVEKQCVPKSPATKSVMTGLKTPVSKKTSPPVEKTRSGRQRKIPLKYLTDFVTEDDALLLKACRFPAASASPQCLNDSTPAKVKKVTSELEKRRLITPSSGRQLQASVGDPQIIKKLTGESVKKKLTSPTSRQVDNIKSRVRGPVTDKIASVGSDKIKIITLSSSGNDEAKTSHLLASIGDSVTIKRLPSSPLKRTASGEEVAKSGRLLKTIGDDDPVKRNPKKRKTSLTSFVDGEAKSKQAAILDSGASSESEVVIIESATCSEDNLEISSKKLNPVPPAFEVDPEIVTKYNLKIPIIKVVPLKSIDILGNAKSSEQSARVIQNQPTECDNKNETTAILNQSAKRKAKEESSKDQENYVKVDEDVIPPSKKSKLETSSEVSSETVRNETGAPLELSLLEKAEGISDEEVVVSIVSSGKKNTPILSEHNEKDNGSSPQKMHENEGSEDLENPPSPPLLEDSISSVEQASSSALDSEENSKLNLDMRINEPNTETEIPQSKESTKTGIETCKSREHTEGSPSLVRVRDIADLSNFNKQSAAEEKQFEDGPSTSQSNLRHPVECEPRERPRRRKCVVSNVTEEVTITKITNNKSEEQGARRETGNDEKTTVRNRPSLVSNSARLLQTKSEEKKLDTTCSQKDTRKLSGSHKNFDRVSRIPDSQQHPPEAIENVITTPDFSILLSKNEDTKLKSGPSQSIQLSLPEISIRVIPLEYYVTQPHLYKNQLITESVKKVIEAFLSELKVLKNRDQLSIVDRDEVVSEQLHALESGSADVSQVKISVPKIDSSVTITPISTKPSSDFLPKPSDRVTPINDTDKGSGLAISENDSSVTVTPISISKSSDFITKPSGRVKPVEAAVKGSVSADIFLKEVCISKTDSPETTSPNLQNESSDSIAKPSDKVTPVKDIHKRSESTAVFLEKDSVLRTDSSLTVTPVLISTSTDSVTNPSDRVTPTKVAADKGHGSAESFQKKVFAPKTVSPKPVSTNLKNKSSDSITKPSDEVTPVKAADKVLRTDSSLTVTPLFVNTSTDSITNPSGSVTTTKAIVDGSRTSDVFQEKNLTPKIDSSVTISESSDSIVIAACRVTPVKAADTESGAADVSQEKNSFPKIDSPVINSPVLKNKASDANMKPSGKITPVKDADKVPASADVFLDSNPISKSDSSVNISPILNNESSDFIAEASDRVTPVKTAESGSADVSQEKDSFPKIDSLVINSPVLKNKASDANMKPSGKITPVKDADKAPPSADVFLGNNPIPKSDPTVNISPILNNESSDVIAKASDEVTPVKAAESGSADISQEKSPFPKTDSPVLKKKSTDYITKTLDKITPVKDAEKVPTSADVFLDNNPIPKSYSSLNISPILKTDSSDVIAKAADGVTPVKAAESGSADISQEKDSFPKTDSSVIISPTFEIKSSKSAGKLSDKVAPTKTEEKSESGVVFNEKDSIQKTDFSEIISPVQSGSIDFQEKESVPKTDSPETDSVPKTDSVDIDSVPKTDSSEPISIWDNKSLVLATKSSSKVAPFKAADLGSGSAILSEKKNSIPIIDSFRTSSPPLKNESSDSIIKPSGKLTPTKPAEKGTESADVSQEKSSNRKTISPILKNKSTDSTRKPSGKVTPIKTTDEGIGLAIHSKMCSAPTTDPVETVPPPLKKKLLDSWTKLSNKETPVKAADKRSGSAVVVQKKDPIPKTDSLETNTPQLKNKPSKSVTKNLDDAMKPTKATNCPSQTSVGGVFTGTRFHLKKRGVKSSGKAPRKTLASSKVTEKEFEHVLLQIKEMSEETPSNSQSVQEEALPITKSSSPCVEKRSGKLIEDGFPLKVRQEVTNLPDKRTDVPLPHQKPSVSPPPCETSQDLLRVLSGEPMGDKKGAKPKIQRSTIGESHEVLPPVRETSPFSSDTDQGDGEWIRVEVLTPSEVVACSTEKEIDDPRWAEPREPSFSSETDYQKSDGYASVLASESTSGLLPAAGSPNNLPTQVSTSAESSENSLPTSSLQVKPKRSFYDTLALRKIIKKARLMSKGAVSAISRGTHSKTIRKRKNLSNEGKQLRVAPVIPLRKPKNLDGKSTRVKVAPGKIAMCFESSSSESQPIQQDGVSSTSETHDQSCKDTIRNECEEVGGSGQANISCRGDEVTSDSQIKSVETFSRGLSRVGSAFNIATMINPTNKPEDEEDVERISQFVRHCFRKLKSVMGEKNISFAKVSVNISLVDSEGWKSSSNKKHDPVADQEEVSVGPNRAGEEETVSNDGQTSGGQFSSQLEGQEDLGASLMEEASCNLQETHSTEDYEAMGPVRYVEQNILEDVVQEQIPAVSDAIEVSLTGSAVHFSTIKVQEDEEASDSGEFFSNSEEASVPGNFSNKKLSTNTALSRSLNEENGQKIDVKESGFHEVEISEESVDVNGKNDQEAPFYILGIKEVQSNESEGWKKVGEETRSTRFETCEETYAGGGIGTCIEKAGIVRKMQTFVGIEDKSALEAPICTAGVEEMQPNGSQNWKDIAGDTSLARIEICDVTKNIKEVGIADSVRTLVGVELNNHQETPVCTIIIEERQSNESESPNTMAEEIRSTRVEICEDTPAEEGDITKTIEEFGIAGEMETPEDIEDKNVQEPPYCTIGTEEVQLEESENWKNVEAETGSTLIETGSTIIETYKETHLGGGDISKNIEEIEIPGKIQTIAVIENKNGLEPSICSIIIEEAQSNQSENRKNMAEETTSKMIAKSEETQAVECGPTENIEDVGIAGEIQTLADLEDTNAENAPFRAIGIEEMQSSESGGGNDTSENRCSIRTEMCEEASSGGGGLPKKNEEVGIAENCVQDIKNKNAQESVVHTVRVEEALSYESENWKSMMEETSSSRIETCEEIHVGNVKNTEKDSGYAKKVLQDTVRTCSKDKEDEIDWAIVAAEQMQTENEESEDGKESAGFGSAQVDRGETKREMESSPVAPPIEKQGISCGAGLVHVCAENETAVSGDIGKGKMELESESICLRIQDGAQIKLDERTEEEERTEIHYEKPSELQDGSTGSPVKGTRFGGMEVPKSDRIPDKAQTKLYYVTDEEKRSETHCQKPFELQGDGIQRPPEQEARFGETGIEESNKIEDEAQMKFDNRCNVEERTETHSERQVELQRSDGQRAPEEEPHTSEVGFKKDKNVETSNTGVMVQKDSLRIHEAKHKCLLPEFYDDANSSQESTDTGTSLPFEPQRTVGVHRRNIVKDNLENAQVKALEAGDKLKADTEHSEVCSEMRLTYDMPILDDVDEINITSAIDYALCTLDEEQGIEPERKDDLASGKKIEMGCGKADTGKKSLEVTIMKSGNTQNLIGDVSKGTGYGCYNSCSQLLSANVNKKESLLTDSSSSSYSGLIMSAGISDQSSSSIFEACFESEFSKDKPPEPNFYPVSVVKEAIGIDIIPSVSFVLPSLLSNADLQEAQSKCLHLDSTGIIFSTSQAVLSSLPELSEDSSSFKSTVMPSLQDPHEVLDSSHHDCTFLSTHGKTLGCPYEEIVGHESLSQSFDMLNEFAVEQQFEDAGLVEEVVTNQENVQTAGISIDNHPYSSQETFSNSQEPDQSLVSGSSNKHPLDVNSHNVLPFLM